MSNEFDTVACLRGKGYALPSNVERILSSLSNKEGTLYKLNINYLLILAPPSGFVWLFDHLGNAVHNHLGQRVAVPEEFANS